jgi:hypothetical protein
MLKIQFPEDINTHQLTVLGQFLGKKQIVNALQYRRQYKTSTYEQLAKEICGNSMLGRSLIDGSLPESRHIQYTECDFNDVGVLCTFTHMAA